MLSLGLSLLTSLSALAGPTYHVAPAGNDQSPGSAAAPFASLERARDAARAVAAQGPTVVVHGGVWSRASTLAFGAADSGSATAPVTWQAAPGAVVRLTGAKELTAAALTPVNDAAVLARLLPEARSTVRQLDLAAQGVPPIPAVPPAYRGAPQAPELFFNDQRMTLARWPNDGWATVQRIVETGSIPRSGDNGGKAGVFEYSGDRPARWSVDSGVWLTGYWCFDWYEETLQAAAIDPATKQITLARPHLYGVKQGNPSPRRWLAVNLLEELDSPGEFWIDRAAHRLYFWPPAPLAGARLQLSVLNAPVVSVTDARHMALRGFTIEAGLATGLEVKGGEAVRIEGCTLRNLRQLGIAVQGGQRHVVSDCDLHDTGTGGLLLEGGDRKTLTPAGHQAINNHIWGFARHQLTYANGLTLSGVGNRAAHNLLHDAPHQAVAIAGNDHVFEFNEIHHVCLAGDDCGALYKGRNPSSRGNIVRANFWHHLGSPMGHGNAAVYFDDGDGGEVVEQNVFLRCGDPGKGSFGTVFCHGGHDNLAQDNVFIECRRAIGSAPWNDQRWAAALKADDWQNKLLKEVDITSAVYTTRYPALVGYLSPTPGVPRVNHARRNVFVMCGEVSSGNWQWPADQNLVTAADPGFVNAAAGDFRLRPDAALFTTLPGFVAPPFARMGLQVSPLRPTPPARTWNYPPLQPAAPPSSRAGAAPAATRSGPAPVHRVPPVTTPPTVDGRAAAGEYPGDPLVLAFDYQGTKLDRQAARAWLAYDPRALYLRLEVPIPAATKLTSHDWGTADAVELSLRPAPGKPYQVVRVYGDGRLEYGTTDGSAEPRTADPGAITAQVTRPAADRWTVELQVPWAMLDIDPSQATRLATNLTIRKPLEDLWLMWHPTQGNSYLADRAGILELQR